MNHLTLSPHLFKISIAIVVAIAGAFLAIAATEKGSAAQRGYAAYVSHLNRTLHGLFRPESGATIAQTQLGLIVATLFVCCLAPVPLAWGVFVAIGIGPTLYLKYQLKERITKIESQIDGFVVALANALKSSPSLGSALQATIPVLPSPTRQEVELVLKEVRIGSTIEQGLAAMSARIKSRSLDTAISAVLVGIRIGGDLPAVLERTAATLREMNRLAGVIRTKTGEARMQLWVLALFPIGVVLVFNAVQEGYFNPLEHSIIGQIVIAAAGLCWVSSLLIARKILAVDI